MAEPAGIRWIEQVGPLELKIHLTDGSSNSFTFPKPEPGAVGATGQAGRDGADSTVAGPRGPAGTPGRDGKDGLDGFDGTAIDTAIVNSSGNLLISLTNGEIIVAGKVIGPVGQSGERGATGLPGSRGADGSAFLSGEAPPNDAEDGNDGDMWLDLSSPQMDVYGPKRGGAWGPRRFFMKQPPAQENVPLRSLPVGGGSGGGGSAKDQPPFRVVLPASTEILIGTTKGEATIVDYKVTSTADNTQWSAGNMNAAANGITADGEVFTLGAELTGAGGDLDLVWRIERDPGLDELTVFATSPVDALLVGRFSPYTNV